MNARAGLVTVGLLWLRRRPTVGHVAAPSRCGTASIPPGDGTPADITQLMALPPTATASTGRGWRRWGDDRRLDRCGARRHDARRKLAPDDPGFTSFPSDPAVEHGRCCASSGSRRRAEPGRRGRLHPYATATWQGATATGLVATAPHHHPSAVPTRALRPRHTGPPTSAPCGQSAMERPRMPTASGDAPDGQLGFHDRGRRLRGHRRSGLHHSASGSARAAACSTPGAPPGAPGGERQDAHSRGRRLAGGPRPGGNASRPEWTPERPNRVGALGGRHRSGQLRPAGGSTSSSSRPAQWRQSPGWPRLPEAAAALGTVLNERGQQFIATLDQVCFRDIVDGIVAVPSGNPFIADPTEHEPFASLLRANTAGAVATGTPMLVLHPADDYQVPLSQSEEFFARVWHGPGGRTTSVSRRPRRRALRSADGRRAVDLRIFAGAPPVTSCPPAAATAAARHGATGRQHDRGRCRVHPRRRGVLRPARSVACRRARTAAARPADQRQLRPPDVPVGRQLRRSDRRHCIVATRARLRSAATRCCSRRRGACRSCRPLRASALAGTFGNDLRSDLLSPAWRPARGSSSSPPTESSRRSRTGGVPRRLRCRTDAARRWAGRARSTASTSAQPRRSPASASAATPLQWAAHLRRRGRRRSRSVPRCSPLR